MAQTQKTLADNGTPGAREAWKVLVDLATEIIEKRDSLRLVR
jgi:hypothetical protein